MKWKFADNKKTLLLVLIVLLFLVFKYRNTSVMEVYELKPKYYLVLQNPSTIWLQRVPKFIYEKVEGDMNNAKNNSNRW